MSVDERDVHVWFEELETALRQRISNLLAKLGSKLFDISRRLDEHDDQLDDHEVRLKALEAANDDQPVAGTDDLRKRQLTQARAIMRRMVAHFSMDELIELMMDFGMDYESFAGAKEQQVRAVVVHFFRRNTLSLLVMRLKELRPHVEWPQI